MKRMGLLVLALMLLCIGTAFGRGDAEEAEVRKVVMADNSWDSILVHNRIVAFIMENGYGGYEFDFVPGDTAPLFNGLRNGDIDVYMESWHENFLEVYNEAIDSGDVINIGPNMPPAPQGWYIPRYMVEGDPARGIEPMAPDLESVEDLPKYWELVRDPENPSKGRILVGPPGWLVTEMSQQMIIDLGLADYYEPFLPGSGTALAASMVGAYEQGEPWIGYYWEPTAVLGRLDMIMIPGTEFPPTSVDILVNTEFSKTDPVLMEMLKKYNTTIDQNNKVLAAMQDNDLDAEGAAEWFLRNFEDTWTDWVPADVAENVKAALK